MYWKDVMAAASILLANPGQNTDQQAIPLSSFSKTGAQIRHKFLKPQNVQEHFSSTGRQGRERECLHLCRNQFSEKPLCLSLDVTGSKGLQADIHCPQ